MSKWTSEDIQTLVEQYRQGPPTKETMEKALPTRSYVSCLTKASKLHVAKVENRTSTKLKCIGCGRGIHARVFYRRPPEKKLPYCHNCLRSRI